MSIKVFIVDDEPLARDELVYLLNKNGDIELLGEAGDGEEAVEKILVSQPDVIFLDIHMPNMDGLTTAKKLMREGIEAIIVFATAYDQHAIEAFEINAIDYLLKPFDEQRVKLTLERIKKRLEKQKVNSQHITEFFNQFLEEKEKKQSSKILKLAVQNDERVIFIDPEEIIYAYREGREVLIKTKNFMYTSKYTLQELETKLEDYHFFRTHRSYLVNLSYAQEMIPWFHGAYNLLMKDNKQSKVPVSRQYVKSLRKFLEL